jgi:hypothetical protein
MAHEVATTLGDPVTDRPAIDFAQILRTREPYLTVGGQDCIVLTIEERDALAAEFDTLRRHLADAERDRDEGDALAGEVERLCARVIPDLARDISTIVTTAAAEGHSVAWACKQISALLVQGQPVGPVH